MSNNVTSQILAFISGRYPQVEITSTDNIFQIGFVNSLFAMELVMFIEKTFGVTVPNDELRIENFHSAESMTELVDRLRRRHAECYLRHVAGVRPLPGARELLTVLTDAGIPWAIATSGRMETAAANLEAIAHLRRGLGRGSTTGCIRQTWMSSRPRTSIVRCCRTITFSTGEPRV